MIDRTGVGWHLTQHGWLVLGGLVLVGVGLYYWFTISGHDD